MTEVFHLQQPFMAIAMDHDSIRTEADALMPRSANLTLPEPNPPFVFPMQSERNDTSSAHNRAASTVELSGAGRSPNRSRPQRLSLNHSSENPLPAFDFNPSASSGSATTPESPTRSPTRSRLVPAKSSGHRRNGSEYIGGNTKFGGTGLMSTSPTKREGTLPTLQPSRTGPPNSRRGHAHRRSGAVSSHDLSMILKPAGDRRGSCSAPTTPSDPATQRSFVPHLDRSISQPTLLSQEPETPTMDHSDTAVSDQPRRVGFAETVEYIPRPLSTISSETSSSLSTARANHSVTGSITSIVSAGTSSPPSTNVGKFLFEPSPEHGVTRPRPKTAGPIMHGLQQGLMSNQEMVSSKRPSSASSMEDKPIETVVPSTLPNWKFPSADTVNFDEPTPEAIITPTDDPTSIHPLPLENLVARGPRRRSVNPSSSAPSRPRTSPEPKISKRQRKVKSWAGSILSRKARLRDPVEDVVNSALSLSPLDTFAPDSELSLESVNFDEDTTCVIRTPDLEGPKLPTLQTDISTWKPRESRPSPDSDSIQMLDLDAAFGPYTTPSLGSAIDDPMAGGFSAARRRMHSSINTGTFMPGMQLHRRAESAPEMAPINYHTFGISHRGSNNTMADVFEEEEEEEEEAAEEDKDTKAKEETHTRSANQSEIQEDKGDTGLGVEIVDADDTYDIPMQRNTRRKFQVVGDVHRRPPIMQEHSVKSLSAVGIPEEISPVEIVGAEDEPRFSMVTKSSDESTITPTLSHDPFANRPVSAPIGFVLPKPNMTLATPETYSSAVSSPDFSRSSFDIPRLHTAHSSITDRATLNSSRAGDHGIGAQASVEDVPSLTSSASTMMSAQPRRFSGSAYARSSAERSASLSATVPSRSRPATAYKRSSLASLSRLVGSSYGEKSKLSIEDRAQPDNAEKKDKKKGNRISRLMRFWKSKEKLSSS